MMIIVIDDDIIKMTLINIYDKKLNTYKNYKINNGGRGRSNINNI